MKNSLKISKIMDIESMKKLVGIVAKDYPIKKIILS